jgi:hypothetical protein
MTGGWRPARAAALVAFALLAGVGCAEVRLTIRHQDPSAGTLDVDVDGAGPVALAPGAAVALSRPPGKCRIDVVDHGTGRRRTLSLWVEGQTDIDIVDIDVVAAVNKRGP